MIRNQHFEDDKDCLIPSESITSPDTRPQVAHTSVYTDVRRGASGTSRDVPIFVQFHKKNQNLYTLVVKKQNWYTLVVKNPKFVHLGGKKTKIRTLW